MKPPVAVGRMAGMMLSLLVLPLAHAAERPAADPYEAEVMQSEGFLMAHPDLRMRKAGVEARQRGRYEEAREQFRIAASYGDKLSQAALADLLWEGKGGDVDRALGYAWMDLAAERGTPWLLAQREAYWNALDADERERAIREGRKLYAEYGDPTTWPRMERELRVGSRELTGSRTGWNGAMRSQARGVVGARTLSPEEFRKARYWDPAAYRQWQDEVLARAGSATD